MEIKIIGFLVLQTSGSVGKYEKNDGSGKNDDNKTESVKNTYFH